MVCLLLTLQIIIRKILLYLDMKQNPLEDGSLDDYKLIKVNMT